MTFVKPYREVDPEFIRWIHGWECVVPNCGKKYPVHAHHTKTVGAGGSDRTVVPLCPDHHVGSQGVHKLGVLTFQKIHNVSFLQLVEEFNIKYEKKLFGPYHEMIKDNVKLKAT